MSDLRNVSSSPHVREKRTSADIMRIVLLALLPATLYGCWHFGWVRPVTLILVCVAVSVATEYIYEKKLKR